MLNIFKALGRLTAALNRAADLFTAANDQLEKRLAVVEDPERPALEGPALESRANGKARKQLVS